MIALHGDLGAGKTTFARAFIRARAQGAAIGEIPSPTFTLVQVYDLPSGAIWHFDLYRLTRPDQVWELGLEEALIAGIAERDRNKLQGQLAELAKVDDLTAALGKLGKDALYESILDPSAGISFGFEGWTVELKNGDEAYGIKTSETADEITIKNQTGVSIRFKKAEIAKLQQGKDRKSTRLNSSHRT